MYMFAVIGIACMNTQSFASLLYQILPISAYFDLKFLSLCTVFSSKLI